MSEKVILVRHGKRDRDAFSTEAIHGLEGYIAGNPASWPAPEFAGNGIQVALGLAGRLADELELEGLKISRILHSEHVVARQTAEVYGHVLNRRGFKCILEPKASLTPGLRADDSTVVEAANLVRSYESDSILVVGHQPDLTGIANELLSPASKVLRWFLNRIGTTGVPAGVLPLGSAESALISLRKPNALLWCLTAKPESLRAELIAKINAKYDVAKFFLGAFVVNSGLVLNAGVFEAFAEQPDVWRFGALWCGVLFLVMALGFTVATLFGYDQLLMPRSFWGGSSTPGKQRRRRFLGRLLSTNDLVERPPSQDQIVLYFSMIRIWSNLFVPALAAAFVSIGCFLCVLMAPVVPMPSWLTITLFSGSSIILLALAVWAFKFRGPYLGVDD